MRGEQHGNAEFTLHAAHEIDHAGLMTRIEADQGFIEEQEFRVAEQALREQQTLPFAARQLGQRPRGECACADQIEHAVDIGTRCGARARQAPAMTVGGHRDEIAAAHMPAGKTAARLRHVAHDGLPRTTGCAVHANRALR